jgi:hypothetical protein
MTHYIDKITEHFQNPRNTGETSGAERGERSFRD